MSDKPRSLGCTAGLLIGGGALSLLLFATSLMFSEGGDGTVFLVLGVGAIIAGLALLARQSARS